MKISSSFTISFIPIAKFWSRRNFKLFFYYKIKMKVIHSCKVWDIECISYHLLVMLLYRLSSSEQILYTLCFAVWWYSPGTTFISLRSLVMTNSWSSLLMLLQMRIMLFLHSSILTLFLCSPFNKSNLSIQ